MFPHTTVRTKTAVDQVGRTVRQMTYFLSSRATANASHHYQNKKKGALALFFDALFSSFANLSLKKRKHAAGAALVLAPGITLDAEKDQIRGRRGPCPHFREGGEELYSPLDIFSKSPLTF